MDKNTLSNYGWIVIAVLVLSVMIALATPFGNYVKAGAENTLNGLMETENNALDIVKIYKKDISIYKMEASTDETKSKYLKWYVQLDGFELYRENDITYADEIDKVGILLVPTQLLNNGELIIGANSYVENMVFSNNIGYDINNRIICFSYRLTGLNSTLCKTELTARPYYVTTDGSTYYGNVVTGTWNNLAL